MHRAGKGNPLGGCRGDEQTRDAIRARRNVRRYQPGPLPADHLARIAGAGWRAPSASSRQHRDFIIVTGPGRLAGLATVWPRAGRIAAAPAAIALVVPTMTRSGCCADARPGRSSSP